jgi:hypothetical protein
MPNFTTYLDLYTYVDVILLGLLRLVGNPTASASSIPLTIPPPSPVEGDPYLTYMTKLQELLDAIRPKVLSMTEEDEKQLPTLSKQVEAVEQAFRSTYDVPTAFRYHFQNLVSYGNAFLAEFQANYEEYQTKFRALKEKKKESQKTQDEDDDDDWELTAYTHTLRLTAKNMEKTMRKSLQIFQNILEDSTVTDDNKLMTYYYTTYDFCEKKEELDTLKREIHLLGHALARP